MAKKNRILTNLLIETLIFTGAMTIAVIVAHKEVQKIHQQEQITRIESNRLKPFTRNAHLETPDNTVDMDMYISETNDAMKFEMNGKTLYWDKRTLFGEDCKEALMGIDEEDQQMNKPMIMAYYIYKYRNLLADWCIPQPMNNYLHDYDERFGTDYKQSVKYLNNKMGGKIEKCILHPLAESRKNYEFAEFQSFYTEVKEYIGLGDNFSKSDLCNLLNTSPEMRGEILNVVQEGIQKIKATEITSRFTDKD